MMRQPDMKDHLPLDAGETAAHDSQTGDVPVLHMTTMHLG